MRGILAVAVSIATITGCTLGVEPPHTPPQENSFPLWRATNIQGIGPIGIDATSIYVQDYQNKALYALDKRTGTERWKVLLPANSDNFGVQVSHGVVVAAKYDLYALDAATGVEKWRLGASQNVGTLSFSTNESLVFPTVHRGTGMAKAIDLRTGVVRWETSIIPGTVVVTPIVDQVRVREPNVNGGTVATSFIWWKGSAQPKGGVAVLDAETGALRWTTMLPVINPQASMFPSRAAIANGGVAVASAEGRVYLYDEVRGTLRWTGPPEDRGAPSAPNPVILDDRPVTIIGQRVIVGSTTGSVTAFDLQSGAQLWKHSNNFSSVYSLVPFSAEQVLMSQFAGEVSVLNAVSGALRWQWIPRSERERVSAAAWAGDTLFANFITGGVSAFRIQ